MGLIKSIVQRAKGGSDEEEETPEVDTSALDDMSERFAEARERGLGETTATTETVAETAPEEGGMFFDLNEPEPPAEEPGMFFSLEEPDAPDPMGVQSVLGGGEDRADTHSDAVVGNSPRYVESDWYGPENMDSPGAPPVDPNGWRAGLASAEGWNGDPHEMINEDEGMYGARMFGGPSNAGADPGAAFQPLLAAMSQRGQAKSQAAPPPITGLEATEPTGPTDARPWDSLGPPQPPQSTSQRSAIPDAYRQYQEEIGQARRKDRARRAIQAILQMASGAAAVGLAAKGRGNAAVLAGLGGRVAQNAVPEPIREQQAQQDWQARRQIEADGRAVQQQGRRDDLAEARMRRLEQRDANMAEYRQGSLAAREAGLEIKRDVADARISGQDVQNMDRETRRAFEYGEGDPELVGQLREQEIQYLRMAWDQLPDDDRSAAWQSAMERAELGEMTPLDIRNAARAMERAGSTRVRGRRRGSGGGGRSSGPRQINTMARDIAAIEDQSGLLAQLGVSRSDREIELAQWSPNRLQSRWNTATNGGVTTNIRNEDQLETQVREVGRVLGNSGEYAIAVRNAFSEVSGMSPDHIRMLMAGRGVPAGLRSADWASAHQAVEVLRLMRGKQLSGAAVSEAEREMIDQSMALAFSGDPAQLISSLRQMRDTVDELHARSRAGYSDDVLNIYDGNMRREIARMRSRVGGGSAPSTGGGSSRSPSRPSGSDLVTVRINGQERQVTRATLERLRAERGQ